MRSEAVVKREEEEIPFKELVGLWVKRRYLEHEGFRRNLQNFVERIDCKKGGKTNETQRTAAR